MTVARPRSQLCQFCQHVGHGHSPLELQRVQIMSSLVQAQMEYRKQQEEMELAMAISLSLAEAEGRPPAPTFGSAFGRLLGQPSGPGALADPHQGSQPADCLQDPSIGKQAKG